MDEICESLDDLCLENLELMEKKVSTALKLEGLVRQGHIELAKARYIRGKESIGSLQIPNEDSQIKSLFNLETSYNEVREYEMINRVPHFDLSLKFSAEELEDIQNPIKWFGVLVPQSLRSAQKHFQEALYVAVELANIQADLSNVAKKLDSLRLLKDSVVR